MRSFSSLAITALLSALMSSASPVTIEKRAAAITDNVLSDMKLMGEYAAAAYCSENYNTPGNKVECASGKCPLVESADSKTVDEYSEEDTSTDVTGYVAADHTNKLIIVSFRGSKTPDNWITNFDIGMTKTDICTSCYAHSGFWNSWTDARDRVQPAVAQAIAANPSYELRVTGHSLGGAIATLAAASLRNAGNPAALYTFGSPRIGGSKISEYISKQSGGNYRITHWNDPVPKVPLLTMGYVHTSPEYYIDLANGLAVQIANIQIWEGAISFRGNGKWLSMDANAHMWYFSSMSTCNADSGKRGVLEIRGVYGGSGDVEVMAVF